MMKGPVPTGGLSLKPPALSAISLGKMYARESESSGTIQETLFFRPILTVYLSGAEKTAPALFSVSAMSVLLLSKLHLTSSEVISRPLVGDTFWNFTPWRSLIVYSVPSGEAVQLSAS